MSWSEDKARSEKYWNEEKEANGWELPRKAWWPLRLPIIRHGRAIFLMIMVDLFYRKGLGSIGVRSGYDEWVLYAIIRGWC